MNEATLRIIIKANTKAARAALRKTETRISRLTRKMAAFGKSAARASKMFVKGFAIAGVAATVFAVKSVAAFNKQERANVQLETLVKNVTGATDENVQALKNQASALQKVGVVGDEVTMMGQAQLATFGLQQESISNLTPALLDMATQIKGVNVTQEDMQTLGNLVGKVMSGQIGALSRYGVTLSDAQKKQLEMGTQLERSAVLAEVLGQNFGGVNEALRGTFQGQMKAAKNTLGDFMELIGAAITNVIKPVISWFNNWAESMGGPEGMLQSLKDSIKRLQPYLPVIGITIATMVVPAFVAWAAAIVAATWPLLALAAAGVAIGLVLQEIADNMGGWSAMWNTLKSSIKTVLDIVIPVLLPAFSSMWDSIKDLWSELMKLWKVVSPLLMPALKVLGVIIGGMIVANLLIFINTIKIGIRILGAIIRVISNLIQWVRNAAGWFGWLQRAIRNAFNSAWATVRGLGGAIINFFRSLPSRIGSVLGGVASAISNPFRSAFNGIARMWNRTVGRISLSVPSWVPGIGGRGFSVPKIPTFAKGVNNFVGGLAIVGEQGPELVELPRGSSVKTNRETRSAISGSELLRTSITKIHNGDVILDTAEAVREYFEMSADDNELVQTGLTPRRGEA